jgi:hypothetical protein
LFMKVPFYQNAYGGNRGVKIDYHADQWHETTKFQLLYTLFPKEQSTVSSNAGNLYCTDSNYDSARMHLHCNLETDCVDGRDERHCPYQREGCDGPGEFSAPGTPCFSFHTERNPVSWHDAQTLCRQRGRILANLKIPEDWEAVRLRSTHGRSRGRFFTDPSFTPPRYTNWTLPRFYWHTYFWSDDVAAFFLTLNLRPNPLLHSRWAPFLLVQPVHQRALILPRVPVHLSLRQPTRL